MTAPRATSCTDKSLLSIETNFQRSRRPASMQDRTFYEKQTINVFLAIKQSFNLKIRENVLASHFILQCDLYVLRVTCV